MLRIVQHTACVIVDAMAFDAVSSAPYGWLLCGLTLMATGVSLWSDAERVADRILGFRPDVV